MTTQISTQSQLSTFNFENSVIRVIAVNGEPWFVAKDVCDAIGLSNSRMALLALDDDEKGVSSTYTLGGEQDLSIVSESGMYTLILRCREAVKKGSVPHRFRKWVTAEVLPQIRKTGQYSQNTQPSLPLAPETLTPEEQLMVQNAVKATHDRTGLSYGEIWARTKNKFKVAKYEQIERTQLRDVLIYIASISAIRTAGKDEIIVPANIFAAIMQHTRLARKLAEKVEPFHRQLQEIMGIDRWCKNDIAALAYDVRAEFNYFLEKGEDLVEQNRREQNEINFANARLKKII